MQKNGLSKIAVPEKSFCYTLAGITSGIADLCLVYDILDNINKYVKASYCINLKGAKD